MPGRKREWKLATRGAGALVGEMAPLQVCVRVWQHPEWWHDRCRVSECHHSASSA